MAHSNSAKSAGKPEKPYPDFPLTWHPGGSWCKKIRGRLFYFGRDWQQALDRYLKERDYLQRGLPVPEDVGALTVADVCNAFLTAKELQLEAGEIGQRHFNELFATCKRLAAKFDGQLRAASSLTPQDFEQLRADFASQYGAVRIGNEITKVKSVFAYAWDAGLLDKPIRFGPTFKKPGKRLLRAKRQQDKQKHGARLFTPDQIQALVKAADVHLRAMIYLGIQAGMGNADCGTLPLSAVNLESGWVDYPRPKTLVERRFPLWPETLASIKDSLAQRPTPKDGHEWALFVTAQGTPYWSEVHGRWVGQKFRKLLDTTGIYRPGLSFYSLRHSFRTVADRCPDRSAVDLVMGHADHSVADHYREGIADDRLQAVVDVVHAWLFPPPPAPVVEEAAEGGAE